MPDSIAHASRRGGTLRKRGETSPRADHKGTSSTLRHAEFACIQHSGHRRVAKVVDLGH